MQGGCIPIAKIKFDPKAVLVNIDRYAAAARRSFIPNNDFYQAMNLVVLYQEQVRIDIYWEVGIVGHIRQHAEILKQMLEHDLACEMAKIVIKDNWAFFREVKPQ